MYKAKSKCQVSYTKAAIKMKKRKDGSVVVSRALVKPNVSNFHPKLHVKKGDLVMVVSGSKELGKGKTGKVLEVLAEAGKVVVEGVNLVTKATKRSGAGQAGLIKKEAPIHAAKVMLYSNKSKKPVRAEFRKREEID